MPSARPDKSTLIGRDPREVPLSCQRIMKEMTPGERLWVGPDDAISVTAEEKRQYELAHTIMRHLAVRAPTAHQSGHPGGPLSSFTFAYAISKCRNPSVDQPLRMSAGHLSLLAYGLQWLFGRDRGDPRFISPQAIIDAFRTPSGLPGHVEAGIGDIPFGSGPLGKGVSNAVGAAFGLQYLKRPGIVDVLMADGDSQEGQIMEAFRLASHLKLGNIVVHGDFNDMQLSGMPSRTVAADFASIAAACGWHVIEVQNGNDLGHVMAAQKHADALLGPEGAPFGGKPVFICYYTTMGFGIPLMEEGSNTGGKNWHGTPPSKEEAERLLKDLPDFEEAVATYETFRKNEGTRYASGTPVATDVALSFNVRDLAKRGYVRSVTKDKGTARKDFGATHLKALMKADPRILVLHADLAGSGGFDVVEKEFPDRVINVGIAEANMVMMAAGMRQVGLLPVTYTFAAFGTNEARANVRLIDVNCGHTRCAVLYDCTHTGLSVGEDGETHQERHYLNIPFDHTQVWMPGDGNQSAAMAERGLALIADGHTSVFVITPRSGQPQLLHSDGAPRYGQEYVFDGRADIVFGHGDLRDSVTVVATGNCVHDAMKAAASIPSVHVRVLNVASIRPIDAAAILQAALETARIVVVEDHSSEGGLATQVSDVLADFNVPCSLRRLGVNRYYPSGTDTDLKLLAGLDADSIADAIEDEVRVEVRGGEDAFVTAVHELARHIRHSRFGATVLPFVVRLQEERGYLESLRELWAKRECKKAQLPSNGALREALLTSL